uniref:alpha/beta hydrolase n=1 Tax=uncultured Limosilactobacillus sp. TaxID=2837629 RepID=UPI0025F2CE87
MKKVGKYAIRVIAVIVGLLLCGQLAMISGSPAKKVDQFAAGVRTSNVPTLLIPGWGGGTPSYHRLIMTYQRQKIAQKVMTIWVFPNGKCFVRGHLATNCPNQLIQLLYVWNYTPTYNPQTKQLTAVLTMLHKRYHVNELNVIAHSYGGSEWANAVLRSSRLQQEIKYQRVILLGVPLDESFGTKTRFGLHLLHKSTDRN